jgi:hypothetical protein
MDDAARLIALDALRSASLWFTKMNLDGDDCYYMNGGGGRSDGKCAEDDAEELVHPKLDAAIEALSVAPTSDPAIEAWNLLEALRASEGSAVTLVCDNPDFNDQPNNKIEVCADWTGWDDQTFTGDTILEALRAAHAAMTGYAK